MLKIYWSETEQDYAFFNGDLVYIIGYMGEDMYQVRMFTGDTSPLQLEFIVEVL